MRSRDIILAGCLGAALLWACGDGDLHAAGDAHEGSAGAAPEDSGSKAEQTFKVDRSALGDVGTDAAPLDYSDRRLWLCQPGNDPDECDRNLDATELLADGSRRVVPHVKASDPKFDCFFIYGTVQDGDGPMTDFSNVDLGIVAEEGATFDSLCRVYTPLYRQTGYGYLSGYLPYGITDVRAAFKYYLDHLNHGRKFVLIGHSQGADMLGQVVAQDIDDAAAVRSSMISALLIGGQFMVEAGKTTGGTLKNIPLCDRPAQVGCVIAYSSFAKEAPPTASALFGRNSGTMEAACTEPAALAGNTGRYKGSYLPLTGLMNPYLSFVPEDLYDQVPSDLKGLTLLYRDVFRGRCQDKDGYSYLEVSLEMADNDPRPRPPYRSATFEGIGFGTHLVDFALPMDDLIDAVRMQADAALR